MIYGARRPFGSVQDSPGTLFLSIAGNGAHLDRGRSDRIVEACPDHSPRVESLRTESGEREPTASDAFDCGCGPIDANRSAESSEGGDRALAVAVIARLKQLLEIEAGVARARLQQNRNLHRLVEPPRCQRALDAEIVRRVRHD